MRNIKSLLIFLISIKYIEQKQIFHYIVLNLFGMLFHSTAILFIPLYFILDKKIKTKYILFLFIVGNCLFLLHINIFSSFFELIGGVLSGSIGRKVVKYILNAYGMHGLSPSYFERLISFSVVLYCTKNYKLYGNKQIRIFINSFFIYILIPLFFNYSVFYERIMPLFAYSYWVMYPICYFSLKHYNKFCFLAFFVLYGCYASIHSNNNLTAKYDNILFMTQKDEKSRVLEIQESASQYMSKTRK